MYRARFFLLVVVIASASFGVARSQEATPASTAVAAADSGGIAGSGEAADDIVSQLHSAMRSRVSLGYDRKGQPVFARHCRKAPGGCDERLEEFARYLVDASQAYHVDPWLMAAMAFKESGLNPFAKGPMGELGILQIHPKRRDARQVRFIRDGWYRLRCHREPGACQREVVRHAAHVLARSLALCGGDLADALGAYNTGRCGGNRKYSKNVLMERGELRRVAGLDSQETAAAPTHAHPNRS
jgi:soluble lytic murein transglycosylase-like protein